MSFIVEQVFGFLSRTVFSALRDERGTSLVFFNPHGSCVLSDLGACPGHKPDHWLWRQDSAAKIMRQPQLANPRPPDDAKRLGCHRGIFHHRGSGYLSRLSGSEGNTTLLRAKGTRHVGKNMQPPQLSTPRPPDDRATTQDWTRNYLASRLG